MIDLKKFDKKPKQTISKSKNINQTLGELREQCGVMNNKLVP